MPATQQATQMLKASDGKMRVDYPNMSVITNPQAGHAMVLDHLKQQVKMVPMAPQPPQLPGMPHLPGMPNMPALPQQPNAPHPPVMSATDLGKATIDGHPVEGKQYTLHMPTMPAMPKPPSAQVPGMPQTPGMPQAPAMAQAPGMPGAPKAPALPSAPTPPVPTVSEVWSSKVTGMPVLSKTTGEFGTQTMSCQTAPVPEPHPSLFQAPPNYTLIK
jgi:hypothetical protein